MMKLLQVDVAVASIVSVVTVLVKVATAVGTVVVSTSVTVMEVLNVVVTALIDTLVPVLAIVTVVEGAVAVTVKGKTPIQLQALE